VTGLRAQVEASVTVFFWLDSAQVRRARLASGGLSEAGASQVDLLGNGQRVVNLDSEVPDRAF